MIGAIVGDIIGSRYEGLNRRPRTANFYFFTKRTRFTDDTVLSVAIAHAILESPEAPDYKGKIIEYALRYPKVGYGRRFKQWLKNTDVMSDSYGNGAIMRISPIAWAYEDLYKVRDQAKSSAIVTHNHEEAIKASLTVASCIYRARNGESKKTIFDYVRYMGYDIKPCSSYQYEFNSSSKATVPLAVSAFLQSKDFEQAVRYAVCIGGDSDTIACVAGAIAEAYYGVPDRMVRKTVGLLDDNLRSIVVNFCKKYTDISEKYLCKEDCFDFFDEII